MSATPDFDRFGFSRRADPAHKIGERGQLRCAWLQRFRVGLQSHHRPASRGGQLLCVRSAEVVAVRLGMGCEWTEHCRLIGVHIRERRNR